MALRFDQHAASNDILLTLLCIYRASDFVPKELFSFRIDCSEDSSRLLKLRCSLIHTDRHSQKQQHNRFTGGAFRAKLISHPPKPLRSSPWQQPDPDSTEGTKTKKKNIRNSSTSPSSKTDVGPGVRSVMKMIQQIREHAPHHHQGAAIQINGRKRACVSLQWGIF